MPVRDCPAPVAGGQRGGRRERKERRARGWVVGGGGLPEAALWGRGTGAVGSAGRAHAAALPPPRWEPPHGRSEAAAERLRAPGSGKRTGRASVRVSVRAGSEQPSFHRGRAAR